MKQHVSKEQMIRLERGEIVQLNSAQVEELQHYAPSWVGVYVNRETGFGLYNVVIRDTRTPEQKPLSLKQELKAILRAEMETRK